MATAVSRTKKPTCNVNSLAITRNEHKWTATWKVPSKATDNENEARWIGIKCQWDVKVWIATKAQANAGSLSTVAGLGKGHSEIWKLQVNSFENQPSSGRTVAEFTTASLDLDRGVYYPMTMTQAYINALKNRGITPNVKAGDYVYLLEVTATVWSYNEFGEYTHNGNIRGNSITYVTKVPKQPTIKSLEYDSSTGTFTAVYNAGERYQKEDWYSTHWNFWLYGVTVDGTYTSYHLSGTEGVGIGSTTQGDVTKTVSVSAATRLRKTDYIFVVFEAWNRGLRGDSRTGSNPGNYKASEKTILVCWPNQPTISLGGFSNPNNPAATTGSIYIACNAKHSTKKGPKGSGAYNVPLEKITYQRLRSTTADTKAKAMLETGWADISSDDYYTRGTVDSTADAYPTAGTRTWYRAKAEARGYTVYSEPLNIAKWYVPPAVHTASDDKIRILDVYSGTVDTCLVVILTWDKDDSTGNEVKWATRTWRWGSDSMPNSWRGQWKSTEAQRQAYVSKYGANNVMKYTMALYITDVEPGEAYYIRARRYFDGDDNNPESVGTWAYWRGSVNTTTGSEVATVVTTKPTNLQMNVPAYWYPGENLVVGWSFDGDAPQKFWQIIGYAQNSLNPNKEVVLASGTGASTRSCVLTSAQISKNVKYLGESKYSKVVYLSMKIHTGGKMSNTAKVSVPVAIAPSLQIEVGGMELVPVGVAVQPFLRQQNLSLKAKTDNVSTKLHVSITANKSITVDDPPGVGRVQRSGQVLWTASGSPSAANTWFKIPIPNDLDFIDGGSYKLTAKIVNPSTGLSKTISTQIDVDWKRKAKPLTKAYVKTYKNRSAQIYIDTGYENTRLYDSVDIYRVTPDGVSLLAKSVPVGTSPHYITDPFAPYTNTGYDAKHPERATANLMYRIVTRTPHGAMDWTDVPYTMRCANVSFDWDGYYVENKKHLEIPYNLVITDSYTKDFESKKFLDGTVAGYWNHGTERKRSISTDVVKYQNADQIALIRELAHFDGPVFVRTPDGCAFQANVQVNQLDNNYNNPVLAVSFDVEEISLTNRFRHPSYPL